MHLLKLKTIINGVFRSSHFRRSEDWASARERIPERAAQRTGGTEEEHAALLQKVQEREKSSKETARTTRDGDKETRTGKAFSCS